MRWEALSLPIAHLLGGTRLDPESSRINFSRSSIMANFAFRITVAYDDLGLGLLALYDMSEKIAIYEHDADEDVNRTHIHGLIMGCNRKEDTVRTKFFKGIYESTDYELKTKYQDKNKRWWPVDDKYITYMSKGRLQPQYVKGYSFEETEEFRKQWVDFSALKTARESSGTKVGEDQVAVATTPKKQMTVYSHCKAIIDGMKDKNNGLIKHNVIDEIIEYCNKNKIAMGGYKARDWYDCILQQAKPVHFRNLIVALIEKRDGPC